MHKPMLWRTHLVADGGQVAQAELLFRVADPLEGVVHLEVGEQRKAGIHSGMEVVVLINIYKYNRNKHYAHFHVAIGVAM